MPEHESPVDPHHASAASGIRAAHHATRMPHASWVDLQERLRRSAAALRSVVMFLCGIACLIGAAAIFKPAALMAGSNALEPSLQAQRAHQEFVNSLANLVSESHQLLAVHPRGQTPYTEIVVWLEDRINPGQIDSHEIAVISHSAFFRTIKVHSCAQLPGTSQVNAPRMAASNSPASRIFTHADVRNPSFCDDWRTAGNVQGRIIATGITDMRATPIDHAEGMEAKGQNAKTQNVKNADSDVLTCDLFDVCNHPLTVSTPQSLPASAVETSTAATPANKLLGPRLQLWLKWASDSTDGAGEAATLVGLRNQG